MPLSLPNLDDRTFADLVAQMRGLIPRYSKKWTNHNPSDPGITLLELLAWLTEMVLFRLDQIHDRSYLGFLELLGVEPSGTRAEITFVINSAKDELPTDFKIKRGTRIAAIDDLTGEEIIFETLTKVDREQGRWEDDDPTEGIFKTEAINIIVIKNEPLGISDRSPNQVFQLSQRPFFLDKWDETNESNPRIKINEKDWYYKSDLLESHPDEGDFTIEHLAGLVRFGDGTYGKIPPEGAEIFCTYRSLGGIRENIVSGKITGLKDPIPGIDPSLVSVKNEYPVSGGKESEDLEDLIARGSMVVKERSRAVSDEDFVYLAEKAAPGRVARVKVVSNQNLEGGTPTGEGHISLIVLPACEYIGLPINPIVHSSNGLELKHSCEQLENFLKSSDTKKLMQDIFRYLHDRRLITTIVHVVKPRFTAVSLKIRVLGKTGVDLNTLKNTIEEKIARFLDPYEGWEDGNGWPFGRSIYRSELYHIIEGIEEVDHIREMDMNGDPKISLVEVNENNLVCLKELDVSVF